MGGLVGDNAGEIENSYATGDVTGDFERVGGLVGDNAGKIADSYATGDVDGNERVGGLVENFAGTIEDSYTTGDVDGGEDEDVGGLIGENSADEADIANTYWDDEAATVTEGEDEKTTKASATATVT